MNHLLNSTGISILERECLQPNQGIFNNETNELFVGSIYPFMFLGCGKIYTIEQCVDFSIEYALSKIERQIENN